MHSNFDNYYQNKPESFDARLNTLSETANKWSEVTKQIVEKKFRNKEKYHIF